MDRRSTTIRATFGLCLFVAMTASVSAQEPKELSLNGRPLSEWLQRLKSKEARERMEAALAVQQICEAETLKSIPGLVEGLGSNDGIICGRALHALRKIGPAAVPALTDAIKLAKFAHPSDRRWIAWALGMMPPKTKEAVPPLLQLLKDENADVRFYAALELGNFQPQAKIVVPALLDVLKTERDLRTIVDALGNLGPDAKEAIPALITVLKKHDGELFVRTCRSLSKIGPDSHPAIPVIMEELKDEIAVARRRMPVDKDGEDNFIHAACRAFRGIGPGAKAGMPIILDALKSTTSFVREEAAAAFKSVDPEGALKAGVK